ncbi:restriction endonuclease subunit S [Citrobacter koseri]|uniref:restriction endonuclease subunit S n=2 Tax=Enterobacteriaceae TaxID=543 RepID=UPI001FCAAED3|nr:restriction endonuclease subunit S [Citrobacter koseri]MDM9066248.1 restriction endonuclease subunit S [Citrobacter koseri]MDM9082551.1 restriction endonuclease subunit S [Citrobacter koseri]MDM9089118.1 restriction endonuclease subunit S [Citrobacter koseri]MDM9094155.1 restriction endonuclease subunit S [Citrobacter koseri]MDM9270401.1 restriction endonuclease subunit S [Citrobacter koseri]
MVPNGWEKRHLEDILSGPIRNGYSPLPAGVDTGYWILSLAALGDDGINLLAVKPVVPNVKVMQTLLKPGDFLVSRSNTPEKVGRSILFKGEIENCSYPDLMMRFQVDENKVDPLFIEQKLKSYDVRNYLRNSAAGSSRSMVKINKKSLEKTPLLLPPLEEQKKIAQVLYAWDKVIATTKKLLTISEKQKRVLMQQLLTGQRRFQNCSKKWEMVFLGDIAKITTGSSNRQDSTLEGEYTFFDRSEDIRSSDRYLFDGEAIIVPGEGQDFIPKYFVGKFDLHQRTYAIMDFPTCDGKYLFYAIHYFRAHFLSQAVGSTVKSLRLPMFQKMKLHLPTLAEQKKIASILSCADQEIELLQQKLHHLKQEKKALVQQLLTGKRRVNMEVA